MVKLDGESKKHLLRVLVGLLIFLTGVTALDKVNSIVEQDIDKKVAIIEAYQADAAKVRPEEVNLTIGVFKFVAEDKEGNRAYFSLKDTAFVGLNIYETFKVLYPDLTNADEELYIENIVLVGNTAEVYFGGDESKLTNRMGLTGARKYVGLIVFSLTQDVKVTGVDFKLAAQGSYFGPGVYTRQAFSDFGIVNNLPLGKNAPPATTTKPKSGCY